MFDDVERIDAAFSVNAVLGYVNRFVERESAKVIFIAHESEIGDKDEDKKRYKNIKEKVIGKTLYVDLDLQSALDTFIDDLEDANLAALLKNNKVIIEETISLSELKNLRVLQQTIWDFSRLYNLLEGRHRENNEAVEVLLRLFFALSFETKVGRLGADDLLQRKNIRAYGSKSNEAITKTVSRYSDALIGDRLLSDEILVDMLFKGVMDKESISASLDRSRYFVKPEAEPAWTVVWSFWERSEDEFRRAVDAMERQFSDREFTPPELILQVFGLRLLLADMGFLKKRSQVIEECKQYAEDLYGQKKLASLSGRNIDTMTGYQGLGYARADTDEFKLLFEYLTTLRKNTFRDMYPEMANDLLETMRSDTKSFYTRINVNGGGDYYRIPVLASIDPETFTRTFFSLQAKDQLIALQAIQERYKSGLLDTSLSNEKNWWLKVSRDLMAAAGSLGPMESYRLKLWMKPLLIEEPPSSNGPLDQAPSGTPKKRKGRVS